MVTAGVYLLIRCSPLLEQSELVLTVIMITGAITAFFAASVGLFQNDIKKVIAYSTMSQLAREYINIIIINIFRYQTICVELIKNYIGNSQITKTHNYSVYNYINNNFFNSFPALRHYYCFINYLGTWEKWKIIIIRKLVGISEAIRLILILFFLNFNIYCFYKFVFFKFFLIESFIFNLCFYFYNNIKLYSVIRFYYTLNNYLFSSENSIKSYTNSDPFFEWLAGVIDGDGYFNLSKKGTARFQITMDARDKSTLYEIKHKLGGSIRSIANANAFRYQLSHRKGLITLINGINGLIRNPTRMLQMNKLCVKYDIKFLYPKPLTFNNGWLSGFIDSDGSIYLNEQSGQIFISVTQKNKYLLEPLIHLYGGKIYILSPKIEAFKYVVFRKNELFNLVDNYFSKYPLKTKKINRVNLIKQFFFTHISKNNNDLNRLSDWILFKNKWEKYGD